MAEPNAPLIITLHHDGPVPLEEFGAALDRIASRYARFSKAHGDTEDARLYIEHIREGSIELSLTNLAAAAQPLVAHLGDLNTLIGYGKSLAALLRTFNSPTATAAEVSVTDCDDVRAMVRPALHNEGGGLTVAINGDNNVIQPLIFLTASDARQIDNRAALVRAELSKPREDLVEELLFVWDQIRDAPAVEDGPRSPDRGIIAAIDPRPHPVTFADPSAKEAMYRTSDNPFELGFVVDAKVMLGPRGPAAYRITHLHDVVPLDPEAAA